MPSHPQIDSKRLKETEILFSHIYDGTAFTEFGINLCQNAEVPYKSLLPR